MATEAQVLPPNHITPEALRNPVALYTELRSNDPVHWSATMGAWIITRYDDVMNCFRHPNLSADRGKLFEHQVRLMGMQVEEAQAILDVTNRHMGNQNGAEHLRLRRQAGPGFSPQVLDRWRPAIRRTMDGLLSQVQHQGHMDLAKQISYQLPPLVIAELLGIPTEDRTLFQSWSEPLARFASATGLSDMVELTRRANKAMVEFNRYLMGIIEQRRLAPGEDVISLMIHGQEAGRMSQEELVANSVLILLAGHITTTDQISNGMYSLLSHPEQSRMLREDPLLMRSAVEEVMRFDPAIPFIHRVVAETFQLRGKTLKQGDIVFLGMASANRDPGVFPDAERFDITRDSVHQKHLSFAFGPHHCLGAGLARRELEICFEMLLERFPGLCLDEEQPPKLKSPTLLFRGFESLHVRW